MAVGGKDPGSRLRALARLCVLARAGTCLRVLARACACWRVLVCAGACWRVLACAGACAARAGTCWRVLAQTCYEDAGVPLHTYAPAIGCAWPAGQGWQSSRARNDLALPGVHMMHALAPPGSSV